MNKPKQLFSMLLVAVVSVGALSTVVTAQAGGGDSPFSLEVSPSPLIISLKPGERRDVELQIRNTGTSTEKLKVGLRDFGVDEQGAIDLKDSTPKEVNAWVTFASPQFSVQPGELFTEKISFSVPKETAFTYTFAVTIARVDQPKPAPGKQAVKGTVAVLSILSIDKPGAVRSFEVLELKSSKRMYEYLPAEMTVKVKNTGNVAVQPAGNLFVQRKTGGDPISTLVLNTSNSYVLPGSTRDLKLKWDEGFPVYVTKKDAANATEKRQLVWDWGRAQNFRFGKYTAKLVAFYSDGQRQVPVYSEVSFWVVPWKLITVALLLLMVGVIGVVVVVRKLFRLRHLVRRTKHYNERD